MEIKDVLGIEPIGQAGLKVTEAAIKGVSSFLEVVFKPGLEEIGYLFKDRVRLWRLNNILRTIEKSKDKLSFDGQQLNLIANPRVGLAILEECSMVDDCSLQDLWAGLFVSSCTQDGKDDSNMIFVDLLRRMSSVEARIIDYACRECTIVLYPNGLFLANEINISFEKLKVISGCEDLYRLDNELDHMRSLELLVTGGDFTVGGGFSASDDLNANITPGPLALYLFYKTHSTGSKPIDFWADRVISSEDIEEKSPRIPYSSLSDIDDSTLLKELNPQ